MFVCLHTELSLDNLLFMLRPQVTPKWYQFGVAVGTPQEVLDGLSGHANEECVVEIADYWIRQSKGQLTWMEVANIAKKIGLQNLAEEITTSINECIEGGD